MKCEGVSMGTTVHGDTCTSCLQLQAVEGSETDFPERWVLLGSPGTNLPDNQASKNFIFHVVLGDW